MFSFLSDLFSLLRNEKRFQFLVIDGADPVPPDRWYKRSHWKLPNVLRMQSEHEKGWRCLFTDEPVVGVTFEDRQKKFLLMGDKPDFRVFLQREPGNPHDKNAIKVMGSAMAWGCFQVEQLGFLSRETAQLLGDVQDIDARPSTLYLPYKDRRYGLRLNILVKAEAYESITRKWAMSKAHDLPDEEDYVEEVASGEGKSYASPKRVFYAVAFGVMVLLLTRNERLEKTHHPANGSATDSSVHAPAIATGAVQTIASKRPETRYWRGKGSKNRVAADKPGQIQKATVNVNEPNLLVARGVFARFEVRSSGRVVSAWTGEMWSALTFTEKQKAATSVLTFYNAKDKNTNLLIIVDGNTAERLGTVSTKYPALKLK